MRRGAWRPGSGVAVLAIGCLALGLAQGADVLSYSVLKGQFLNQTGPQTLRQDPDFGHSLLVSVDLADLDLLNTADLRLPDGESVELDDYSDSWSLLDTYQTAEALDAVYTWGDYVVSFDAVHDGKFHCLVTLPEKALPPVARLTNWEVSQAVDPTRPLTLNWVLDGEPGADDFLQVYVNLGHGEVFSTPNLGEPGALRISDRTVTLPPETLIPGAIHELNLEITRVVSTETACHPSAQGVGALFRSTSVDLFVFRPPQVGRLEALAGGGFRVEVVADPGQPVALQGSPDLQSWEDVASGNADSGTNRFDLATSPGSLARFFRAVTR